MEPDAVTASELDADTRVMAAVEEGPVERLIVADMTREDAYLTAPLAEAASLPAWR